MSCHIIICKTFSHLLKYTGGTTARYLINSKQNIQEVPQLDI